MLKFQLATKADLREAAIIQQKRRYEEERKARIFNSKNRILGVDLQGLEQQLSEKKQIDQTNQELEQKFIDEEKRRAEVLTIKSEELQQERRRIQSEINDYRKCFQKKEDTREFDLNDPKYIQKSIPSRMGDDDPRLGISSAQKFMGEDLMSTERLKSQKDQQKLWLQQQMKERQQAEQDRNQAEREIQAALESRDKRAMELANAERETRRLIQESTAKFNLNLAASQENQKMTKKRYEEEDNLAEIYNHLTSDMLTENKDCANSNFGINRIIPTNFRGMTDEEIEKILIEQKIQQTELKNKRNDEKMLNAKWEQMTNNMARIQLLKEREVDRKKRSLEKQLQMENNQLAAEQVATNDYIKNVIYTNQPTQDYFMQFNTTTR